MASNDESIIICSPKSTKSVSNASYSSKSIENLLKNKKNEYKVVDNSNKRLTAACWTTFGFPVRVTNENQSERILGFVSCKHCFETFRYLDGSTSTMNDHRCPKSLSKGQQSLEDSIHSLPKRPHMIEMQLKNKKENIKKLSAQWVSSSMRPFQIVSDQGFRKIIQECLNIDI